MINFLKKVIFFCFNKLFHTTINRGNIEEVRLISNSGLKFKERDLDLIRTIIPYKISFGDLQSFLLFYDNCQKNSLIFDSGQGSTSKANQFFNNLFNLIESNISDGIADYLSDNRHYYFSQEGEDIILSRFFENKTDGYYIDVGAHHPTRFSNTHFFYQLGWRGINIEPTQEVNELFIQMRPEDINLSIAVSNSQGESNFYVFEESALNTFSQSLSMEYQNLGFKLIGIRKVETKKLSDILQAFSNNEPNIDFMSVDVENHELEVLESNDWIKYRPNIVLVEILNFDINDPMKSPIHNFLLSHGYEICAKTYNTVFYKDTNRPEKNSSQGSSQKSCAES